MKEFFKTIIAFLVILLLLAIMTTLRPDYAATLEREQQIVDVSTEILEAEFTIEALIAEIGVLNFKYPHIVLAQAKLETGYFTSSIFRENNNLFGMKRPRVRPTYAVGENRGHAVFEHWQDSVKDYRLYSHLYMDFESEWQYYNYLARVYAEDPNYVNKIRYIIRKEGLSEIFQS